MFLGLALENHNKGAHVNVFSSDSNHLHMLKGRPEAQIVVILHLTLAGDSEDQLSDGRSPRQILRRKQEAKIGRPDLMGHA